MPGAVVQVVARGNQDAYLTSKPQVTQWKAVFKRTTIFGVESIEQVFNGQADFGKRACCTLQRQGDLVAGMFVRMVLPALASGQAWCPRVGHAVIKTVELHVGGTKLESHTGDWLNVLYELQRNVNKEEAYNKMIGNTDELTTVRGGTPQAVLWIPLQFSNCRHNGLAIPYVALQYHDIRVEVEFNELRKLVCGPNAATAQGSMVGCSLYCDYVFLGQYERTKFAEASHEYLIEQVQYNNGESVNSQSQKFRVDFNHPTKALNINIQQTKYTSGQKFMAWVPNDFHAQRVLATKRMALAFGTLGDNGFYVGHTSIADAGLKAAITAARVCAPDVSGDPETDADALIVAGELLDDRYTSMTVPELLALVGSTVAAARPGYGDGAASKDCVVYDYTNYGLFLNRTVNPVNQVLIQLNNTDRLSKRESMYFSTVQHWQSYEASGAPGLISYSFAIKALQHQPQGTCNMSRIDNANVSLEFITSTALYVIDQWLSVSVSPYTSAICNIYGPCYNVFRIIGGMGGTGFAN